MLLGGAVFAIYAVWVIVARLPADLAFGTRVVSSVWAIALFAGAGMVLAGAVGAAALIGARAAPGRWRAPAAAVLETALVVPLFTCILLNEFVYSTTSEVLSADTLLLVWHNAAAVFENAWRMGARHLITVGACALAAAAAVGAISLRSFRRLASGAAVCGEDAGPTNRHTGGGSQDRDPGVGPQGSAGAVGACDRGTIRLAGAIVGALATVGILFAWQCVRGPGEALLVLLRAAPAMRAMNLAPALAGLDLMGPPPAGFGPPIVSEAAYKASMGSPRTPPPNVVFILLESVSAKALHCYGYPREDITPNIDALAAGGTLFEHCVDTASFSVCGLTSTMTSLYMLRGERFDHFADTSFPFMGFPHALKLAGYQLALFSSGNESFDDIRRFYPPEDFDKYYSHDTCDVPKADCMRMDDRHAVGEFETWITARTDPRPFYCHFYLQSTHFNYEVPEPWASHYQPVPPLYSNGDGILHIPADVLPRLKNQYDNALRYADHWVGRIRAALEKAGAFDNSIIVIVADHGEAFMEHGLARHGVHVWEEMIHIPLIVHLGKVARASLGRGLPSRVADTVSGLDVAPTIAGLVGIAPHPSWQGVDVLAAGYTGRDRPVFSMTQYTRWQEAVCINRLKYMYDLTDVREYLFDLRSDPGERDDLSARRPDLIAVMRQLVSGWHTHQLRYYAPANRPFTHYIGRYVPDAELLERLHVATGAPLTARR